MIGDRHPFQWLPGNIDLSRGTDAVLNGRYNTLSSPWRQYVLNNPDFTTVSACQQMLARI